MNFLRVILALIVGVMTGGIVNMALVMLGSSLIPAPPGMDATDVESVAALAHLFEPKHFLFPFLAHATGTLTGAISAYLVAGSYRNAVAWVIGALFFAGGVAAARMIPAPAWFIAADLVLAYFPTAFLATKVGAYLRRS